ncbi:MAG: methyltransferase [Candidatus Dojkabacteria bacterium]|nr:methyltransferase [Candidatus Dojkabacteria bacterium]MDQ7021600.1 methyltransferase [Candidatus Dojkabacteria bacterium]
MIDSNKKLKKFFNTEFDKLREEGQIEENTSEYFGLIGSTQIEDIPYIKQLEVKIASLKDIYEKLIDISLLENIQIVPSDKIYEYRFRMDYVTCYDPIFEPNNRLGQRKHGRYNIVVDMHKPVLFKDEWFQKVRKIYEFLQSKGIENYDLVKHTGNLRYLVIRADEMSLLSIVTKTNNSPEVLEEAAMMALELGFSSVYWLVNDSIRDESDGEVENFWGKELIEVNIKLSFINRDFYVSHNTFFQNNINVFKKISEHIYNYLNTKDKVNTTLLDMFSGVGVLGILFSDMFESIIGYEINSDSIELANKNLELNKITNATYEARDLLQENSYLDFENATVIVDPPRTGLTSKFTSKLLEMLPKEIIYISCNPVTQAVDLSDLNGKYRTVSIKGFDMFPHTYHLENVIILERK